MEKYRHIKRFNESEENMNILYQINILDNNFQLIEMDENEFTGGESKIMCVYKNDKEIDIDTELDRFLIKFKMSELSVDDMCKFIHFYDKFNKLAI